MQLTANVRNTAIITMQSVSAKMNILGSFEKNATTMTMNKASRDTIATITACIDIFSLNIVDAALIYK